jgi:beta-glucanase (GH16 family)
VKLRTSRRPGAPLRTASARLRLGAVWAAALATIALAAGASASAPARTAARASVIVHETVTAPGAYSVTVIVGSRTAAANAVALEIGDVSRRALTDRRHRRAVVRARVALSGRSLTVKAVGRSSRPLLSVSIHAVPAVKSAVPAPASTSSNASAAAPKPPAPSTTATATTPAATTPAATTPAATTPAATPSAPAPPAPQPTPEPPGPGSPFPNLVWSDDFTADWSAQGGTGTATEPIPHTWALDGYGGCGNTPPQESSYPARQGDAYLNSSGLVIPVVATGATSYTTAQLDTGAIAGESWQYGAIEASIQLPTGQGLCPAFWMYSQSGPAEIDILEAPSFVGSYFGPTAPYTIFTLHAGDQQVFEFHTTPPGWNSAQPNVYGVLWTPTTITWTVNYIPYATATAASLSQPSLWSNFTSGKLHLLLDEAVGGWPGDPPPGTVFTQPMTVQWVKVFQ